MLVSGTGTCYDILPIVTTYGGDIFSSRLEARWAIYFDSLEVSYHYEPEYFDLPSRHYLPDFYLWDEYTEDELWLEVKPKFPNELEIELMAELCLETGMNGMILYNGLPNPFEECCEEGWYPGIGMMNFETSWEKDGLWCRWQDHENCFPTFGRPFEILKEALITAIVTKFS